MVEELGPLRAHFDLRAPSYSGAATWVTDSASLEPIAMFVAGTHVRRALEIGVGSGAVPAFLRRSGLGPTLYVGLDVSAAMLRHAEGWLPVQGDASHLPCCDNIIDLLVVRQAFHYFENPAHVLAEAARVLTDPGRLLIAQITPFDDDADAEWWSRAVALRQPMRRHFWTAASLEHALRSGGFSVEAVMHVAGRSSLRNWLNRYPIDDFAAQELVAHYQHASDVVRRTREFEFRPDGDIQFSIRWSILFACRSCADAEPRTIRVQR